MTASSEGAAAPDAARDAELAEALRLAELGLIPSPFGELELLVALPRTGESTTRPHRDRPRAAVRAATARFQFLLTGDVQLAVDWFLPGGMRTEGPSGPGVERRLAAVLDALCGPAGLLVDAGQVQAITWTWLDWARPDQQLGLRLRFAPEDWLLKDGIVFVHLGDDRCVPIPGDLPPREQARVLRWLDAAFALHAAGDPAGAAHVLPMQRIYHRRRLGAFPVVERAELTT